MPGSKWTLVAVELILLATFCFGWRGRRGSDEPPPVRMLCVAPIAFLAVANFISLGLLVSTLIRGGDVTGRALMLSAIQIWGINVVVFALWHREWDRGGSARRSTSSHVEFRFPQDGLERDWDPRFFDYFYVSFTNATAFSPTDAMPLTRRTKLLMLLQTLASLLTVALLAGRAVDILR